MPNKNRGNFICFLPKMEKAKSGKPVTQLNTSNMIMESKKRIKLKTPNELLEILKDRCFIRQEGWWSYEFCYQKKLRQVHSDGDKIISRRETSVAHHCLELSSHCRDASTLLPADSSRANSPASASSISASLSSASLAVDGPPTSLLLPEASGSIGAEELALLLAPTVGFESDCERS
ncbi:uncharacterized protein LOC109016767 isoform X2 [Juglans regia]|nr:uncharacterized protein LOC109016767 isoform X2 [Juglans regia]